VTVGESGRVRESLNIAAGRDVGDAPYEQDRAWPYRQSRIKDNKISYAKAVH
jgi:hypothetical protein